MVALVVAAVFCLLGLVHFYWAFGGRIGKGAAIPEADGSKAFVPSTLGTHAVGIALCFVSLIVLMRAGFLASPFPGWLLQWAVIALAAVLFLRAVGDFKLVGFFKRVHGSQFARLDTFVYSPLCVALGAGLTFVALN